MKFAFIADCTSNTATTRDQESACRRPPHLHFSDNIQHTSTTEKLSEALKDAGVEVKHAEAIADAIVRNRGELATNWLKWGLGINIVLTICSLTIAIALLVNQLGN